MDVFASIMTYLREYDYLLFPLIVTIIAAFASDNRERLILWSISIVYCLDAVLGTVKYSDVSTFYLFNIFINCAVFLLVVFVKPLWKRVLLHTACAAIICMNYYEHINLYQTFMYPYIDHIHSWYLEVIVLVILIKFKAPTAR